MIKLLLVFLGGGLGCTARYGLSVWLKPYAATCGGFPWHTFAANLLGCLLIGLLTGWLSQRQADWLPLLLVTGFCGGFTTMSTFSLESINLFRNGQAGMALLYAGITLAVCFAAVALGLFLAKASHS